MRKIVACFAISLDGFIAGPNNDFDWITIDKEIDFAEQMKRFDTYLIGRKTYEITKKMGGNSYGAGKVSVFSNTLTKVDKPFQLINGTIKKLLIKLKKKKEKILPFLVAENY